MDINDKSIEELKAIAYDILVSSQKLQNDLAIVNQLIEKKKQAPIVEPAVEPVVEE